MEKRITDMLIGICLGDYFGAVITILDTPVHWALVGLCTMKLGRFLGRKLVIAFKQILKKLVREIVEELNQA